MKGCCALLDEDKPETPYTKALGIQQEIVQDPDRTPSARVLAEMRKSGESFFHFAKRISQQHQDYFKALPANPERMQFFKQEAWKSLHRQQEMEASDPLSFDEYLRRYFAQS
jgi:glutamate--cysteine ligase